MKDAKFGFFFPLLNEDSNIPKHPSLSVSSKAESEVWVSLIISGFLTVQPELFVRGGREPGSRLCSLQLKERREPDKGGCYVLVQSWSLLYLCAFYSFVQRLESF